MLVGSLYNIVDQIFIGQGVGQLGNAATNVSYPFSTIGLSIALLLGVGTAARYSITLGKGNRELAASVVGSSMVLLAIAGILYAVIMELFMTPMLSAFGATEKIMPYAVEYMRIIGIGMPFLIFTIAVSNFARADGSPQYSMWCSLAGALINCVLDPLFIFVFQWGMAGAAYATIIGQFISFGLALAYFKRVKLVDLTREHFRLDLKESLITAGFGMSNCLTQVAFTFVQIALNNSLTYYGAMSVYGKEIPLAAAGIVSKTYAILMAVNIGVTQGAQPVIGYNYGAEDFPRVKKMYLLAAKWIFAVSFAGFLAFQLTPKPILSLFGSGDKLYFEFAEFFMRVFLLMMPVNGIQLLSANFFAMIGKPTKGMILSMTRQVLFFIPLVLLLPHIFGLMGVLYAAPVADFSSFCVTMLFMRREWRLMDAQTAARADQEGQ